MLKHYEQSTVKALLHILPDIGLDITKFGKMPRMYKRGRGEGEGEGRERGGESREDREGRER